MTYNVLGQHRGPETGKNDVQMVFASFRYTTGIGRSKKQSSCREFYLRKTRGKHQICFPAIQSCVLFTENASAETRRKYSLSLTPLPELRQ